MRKPPTQFEYKGSQYQIRRLDAIEQAMLAQKISPLVVPVLRVAIKRSIIMQQEGSNLQGLEIIIALLQDFEVVAEALQKIPAETMREIYATCLSRIVRQGGPNLGWQEIWNIDHLQFDDLEGFDVMYFTIEVIKDQLGNFISEILSTLGLPSPMQTTSR